MIKKLLIALILIQAGDLYARDTLFVWIGGNFDGGTWHNTITADTGEWIDVPIFLAGGTPNVYVGNIGFPLGIHKIDVDSFNADSSQIFYPFTEWANSSMFGNFRDEYQPGWATLSYQGVPNAHVDPWFHSSTPVNGFTFRVRTARNGALINQTICDALGPGIDPISGPVNVGDTLGLDNTYEVFQQFACIHYMLHTPNITGTIPSSNALDVPAASSISATFNIDMNPATFDSTTFLVNASTSGLHGGSITYNNLSRTVTLDPYTDFASGEIVTATLTTGIRSQEGAQFDSSYSWSFNVFVDYSTSRFDTVTYFTPVDSGVYWVVCADLNGDSCLDMASVSTFTSQNQISILFNDCQGHMTPSGSYTVGNLPRTITAADLDGDGDVDLASANSGGGDISVLLNTGNGTFSPPVSYPTGGEAWGIFASDFNGDGFMDLAATTGDSGKVAIFFNNGNGTFPPDHQTISCQDSAFNIYVADYNQDHHPDIAVTSHNSHSVNVFLNGGNGAFPPTPSGSYETSGSSWGLFSADFNGDGLMDLAVTNPELMTLSILRNNGDGTFPPHLMGSYETPGSSWGIFCADYNGDGNLDVALSTGDSNQVIVFQNEGDGTFPPSLMGSYETPGSSWGIFSADLNGDGTMDLAIANSDTNGVSELLNEIVIYDYAIGDVNCSNGLNGLDVTYGVSYFKGGTPPCSTSECPPGSGIFWYVGGDVNGSCSYNGIDITYLITYLKGGPAPIPCPECIPRR